MIDLDTPVTRERADVSDNGHRHGSSPHAGRYMVEIEPLSGVEPIEPVEIDVSLGILARASMLIIIPAAEDAK